MSGSTIQLPTNPDSTVLASLDSSEGWMPYRLGEDVIEGEPNCTMKLLRTVGTRTPYKAVAFFTAEPSKCEQVTRFPFQVVIPASVKYIHQAGNSRWSLMDKVARRMSVD